MRSRVGMDNACEGVGVAFEVNRHQLGVDLEPSGCCSALPLVHHHQRLGASCVLDCLGRKGLRQQTSRGRSNHLAGRGHLEAWWRPRTRRKFLLPSRELASRRMRQSSFCVGRFVLNILCGEPP